MLVIVVVIKLILARWVATIGDELESNALQGDAWHHASDALTSIAAFIGISIGLICGPGYEAADDWAALFACAIIGFSGIRLLRFAVRDVLDVAPEKEFEQRVRKLASGIDGVKAVEKCRIRKSGLAYFVDIHVQVDGEMTVRDAHSVGGKVRDALRNSELRIADALIHTEPFPG